MQQHNGDFLQDFEDEDFQGEFLTVREISEKTGLTPDAIRSYTSGRLKPELPAERVLVTDPGLYVQTQVKIEDFLSWWKAYRAKLLSGAAAHKKHLAKIRK